jgi:hypothetical protein
MLVTVAPVGLALLHDAFRFIEYVAAVGDVVGVKFRASETDARLLTPFEGDPAADAGIPSVDRRPARRCAESAETPADRKPTGFVLTRVRSGLEFLSYW